MVKSKYKKEKLGRIYLPAIWCAGFGITGSVFEIIHRILGGGGFATTAVALTGILTPLSLGSLLWLAIRVADAWDKEMKSKIWIFIAAAVPALLHLALMAKYLGMMMPDNPSPY